jgi:hypothetical protein
MTNDLTKHLDLPNILCEDSLHRQSTLLWISLLTILVIDISHSKTGLIPFSPFEIAGRGLAFHLQHIEK